MSDYKELIERLHTLNLKECDNAADAIAALMDELKTEKAGTTVLREELAAAKMDAERYRWLRENQLCEISDYGDIGLRFNCDFENYNNIDAAIDAAMQENRDEQD